MLGRDDISDHNATSLKLVDNWRGLLMDSLVDSTRCRQAESKVLKETNAYTLNMFAVSCAALHASEAYDWS